MLGAAPVIIPSLDLELVAAEILELEGQQVQLAFARRLVGFADLLEQRDARNLRLGALLHPGIERRSDGEQPRRQEGDHQRQHLHRRSDGRRRAPQPGLDRQEEECADQRCKGGGIQTEAANTLVAGLRENGGRVRRPIPLARCP